MAVHSRLRTTAVLLFASCVGVSFAHDRKPTALCLSDALSLGSNPELSLTRKQEDELRKSSVMDESKLADRFGVDGLKALARSAAWAHGIPEDANRFAYRGMRLSIPALKDIVRKGMKVSRSGHQELQFSTRPGIAVSYSLYPGPGTMGRKRKIPTHDFIGVLFQVDSRVLTASRTRPLIREARTSLSPKHILRVWIYDYREDRFVEVGRRRSVE